VEHRRYSEWVTGLWAGRPGSDFKQGRGRDFFSSGPFLGPTQSPIQRIPGVKWLQGEADHFPPYSADVKSAWSYTCTPSYVFRRIT